MTKTRTSYLVWLLAVTLVAITGLAFTAAPAFACGGPVICVDKDAPEGGNGQTWGTAYKYLQDALAAAASGNEIWVAEGVYYPDEGAGQTAGNREAAFWLKSGVGLYGGFVATETLRTQRDWGTHVTVLSGDLAGDDTTDIHGVVLDWENVVGSDNSYRVVKAGDYLKPVVDATAVLDGFTITAGLDTRTGVLLQGIGAGLFTYQSAPTLAHLVFSGNQSNVGGAIYFWEGDSGATSTLTDVTFSGNKSGGSGGAVYCRDTWVTMNQVVFQNNDAVAPGVPNALGGGLALGDCGLNLTDGRFTGNTAENGGGLLLSGGQANLNRVVFDSNQATSSSGGGGGMDSSSSNLTMTDVTFVNNVSAGHGGGAIISFNPASLTRVTFTGNSARLGGGLEQNNANLVITDAFFAGNTASQYGGGLLNWGGDLTMTNAVFQGNTVVPGFAWRSGGGLLLWSYNGRVNLENVTLSGNSAPLAGGIHVSQNGNNGSSVHLQMDNSIVYGNANGDLRIEPGGVVTATYSIVAGGCPSGAACTQVSSADPAFVLPVVQSDVPTSTGDLRLSPTSPGIDAGDNSAVPAGLTTDLDGNPRLVDTPAVADTGSGTPPLVDMGAYEYQGKPNLRIGKTNNVNGVVSAGGSFNWTLTISNTGGDAATFTNGAVILRDDLPTTGATYGLPSAQNIAGLSGTVNCTIAGSTLTCTANGPVTVAGPGQFNVVVPVTPTGMITLTNPRAAGVCQVDPDNVISELAEDNNTCSSDSVSVGQATLSTQIHDAGHNAITSAPIGSTIHGQATLVSSASVTPTGVVTLTLHDNVTCAGPALATDVKTLVNGTAESSSMEARSFYYQVTYSGDSSYQPLTSPCTLLTAYQPGPTFTVNTTADDTFDNRCSDIHCTLREAILAANSAAGANTILFAIGSGQTITLASALPAINDASGELTVDGQAYTVTVSGADQYRLFTVSNSARATLANLTLAHGNYTGGDCSNGPCGGGLKVEAGSAVTLTHSAILSSMATNQGGGIHNAGDLTIQHGTLAGNSALAGGGVYNAGGLTIRQSTLAGNSALAGGGILLSGGSLTLENSTLSGNTATGADSGNDGGGAIDLYNGAAAIINSTIVSNTAAIPARSGIWLEAGALSLHNSIVANNNGANNFQQSGGTFTSLGYNLSNAWNGLSTVSTDLTGDPKLGPLADNGGATLTHLLLTGSPAIDGGDPGYCPAADQRDIPRPQGLRCDIGAYEAEPDLSILKSVTPAGNVPYHGVVTYTIVLTNAGSTDVAHLSLTDTLPAGLAFEQWLQQPGSGLVQNGSAITWTGNLASNTALTWRFTAAHTGSSFDVITNTAYFSSTLLAGSAAAAFSVACPNTLTVQNANDSGPGSLRQAITDVCSGGTIDFAAGLAGQSIGLTSAELTIAKTVTITNPNAPGLQISGNNARRVFFIQPTGVVTLSSLGVVGGTADSGGGIANEGVLVVNAGAFNGNQASGAGGGISNNGTLTVNNSTLSGNQANSGGGIANSGTLTVNNSTFSGNQANSGGGIYNDGTLHLRNSIIANSLGGADCYGSLAANANNLIEDGSCSPAYRGDPLLAPLGDYGGATPTFALLPGSPAINAGDHGEGCLAADQRGVTRPQAGGCDIGAFESRGFNLAYGSGSGQSTLINTAFTNPLILTVSSSAGEPVNGGQVIFTGPGSGAGTHPAVYTATIGGGAVTQEVAANNTPGSYVVTATTRGNLGSPVSYTLTNIAPEIAVLGNGATIAAGDTTPDLADHTDFGSSLVSGGQITRTFTISNSGGADLHLTGAPLISITGPAALDFSLALSPTTPIPPGGTTTFQVRFDPSLIGTRAATVTIASDDGDENPYDFAIQGTGTIPVVQFTQPVYQINEDGTAAGATVALTRTGIVDLASQVEISFTDDTATGGGVDYTSTPVTVTFPAGSVATQTITVPITQDFLTESTESLTMTVVSLSNAQIGSQGEASLQILDDDSAGMIVSPSGGSPDLTISEPDGSDTFNIRLTSQPTGVVTVTLFVSDPSECALSQSVLELTDQNWATGVTVTVTALDDAESDGPKSCDVITNAAASSDPNYAGQNPDNVTVIVNDDDIPGIKVTPTTLAIAEASGTGIFTLSLTSRPTNSADVTVPLTSTCTVVSASVTIPFAAWESGIAVTVTALDDDVDNQPDRTCAVTTGDPASAAPEYEALAAADVADVSVTLIDDDTAGFIISPTSGETSEDGGVFTFTIRLTSQPAGSVVINVTSSHPGAAAASPGQVTFEPLNWRTPQAVTVTGLDDGDNPAGDASYTIQLTLNPATTDPVYAVLDPQDVTAINRDNDIAPVYLPIIFGGQPASGPDLVIDRLSSGSGGPQVVIRNAGGVPVSDAFWVDVYFDPNPAPPPLNRTWQSIAPYGAHWGVTETVDPGETLTLTIGGPYYAGGSGTFPAGLPVYAYVDSINYATTYGNVQESNETNNVFGPVISSAAGPGGAAVPAAAARPGLPGR